MHAAHHAVCAGLLEFSSILLYICNLFLFRPINHIMLFFSSAGSGLANLLLLIMYYL